MLAVAERAIHDPRSRVDALEVLKGGADGRDAGRWVPAALARWAQSVAFVREPGQLGERILPPWRTVATGLGDCDDVAAAVVTYAAVVGLSSGVAWLWTGPTTAHIVGVVGDGWDGGELRWVVDPESGLGRLEDGPWAFAHVLRRGLGVAGPLAKSG